MRVALEIPHPDTKITVFSWNSRYLIKFEYGLLEQTYKLSQFDVSSEDDLPKILTEEFIEKVMHRFREMEKDFADAVHL